MLFDLLFACLELAVTVTSLVTGRAEDQPPPLPKTPKSPERRAWEQRTD